MTETELYGLWLENATEDSDLQVTVTLSSAQADLGELQVQALTV